MNGAYFALEYCAARKDPFDKAARHIPESACALDWSGVTNAAALCMMIVGHMYTQLLHCLASITILCTYLIPCNVRRIE